MILLEKIEQMMDKLPPADEVQCLLDKEPFMLEYKNKIGLIFLVTCLLCGSLLVFYLSAKSIKPPPVLIVDANKDQTGAIPSFMPNQSGITIQRWALEVVQKIYTIDFLHMNEQLADSEEYFTPEAWESYKKTIASADLYKSIKKNKFSMAVVPTEAPLIEKVRRAKDGGIEWVVLIPVMLSFKGDIPAESQAWTIKVVVARLPTTATPKGLGIKSMQQFLGSGG